VQQDSILKRVAVFPLRAIVLYLASNFDKLPK
jgi:hypothetical protein